MVQTRAAKRIEMNNLDNASQGTVRRTDGPETRRRHRKPGKACRLNLDVLFLIAAHVHPIDLLNLARTCKSLRELLMSRVSEFVWRMARRQVKGLPDCPADMTEPEYAHLAFYARCHGCGKYAPKILWSIRRRYCSDCKLIRLCPIEECNEIIIHNCLLPTERLIISHNCITEMTICVDKAQMESVIDEYDRSSDKDQFLREKSDRSATIYQHVQECKYWEKMIQSKYRSALYARKKERARSIFERLRSLGFGPEVYNYAYSIRSSNFAFFNKSKALTDKEWDDAWPKWLDTMNDFKSRRLDEMVYQPRRKLLESEYKNYVAHPPLDSPYFDCLPDVQEVAGFSPFQDIIRAPEGSHLGDKPFESAFSQLPGFVDEWRVELDFGLAELVKIPDHLTFDGVSKVEGQVMTLRNPTHVQPLNICKLYLASAVFIANKAVATYPDVLHTMSPKLALQGDSGDLSIKGRFDVEFLEEAPYIVFACGLDPNVASVSNMDERDARLMCLTCNDSRVRSWRDALIHASEHRREQAFKFSAPIRWQAVGNEYIDAIHFAELSIKTGWVQMETRCLLCHPCIGDAKSYFAILVHLELCHGMDKEAILIGIHYESVGIHENSSVKMAKEWGHVTFGDAISILTPRFDIW